MKPFFPLVLLALTAACSPAPAASCSTSDAPPEIGVIRKLMFARETDGVSDGFDLDGAMTLADEPTGCGVPDYTGPNGEPGIDNAFARLIPALMLTEAQAIEGIVQNAINSGELLMMFSLTGADSPTDDDCVDLEVLRGLGQPNLGTDRQLESGQTFDRDPSVPPTYAEGLSRVDGSLEAHGLELAIPLQIFLLSLDFKLENAAMRIDSEEDGTYRGVMAGGIDVESLIEVASYQKVDAALLGILESLLTGNVDLAPDAAGECQQISMTFEFEATPAFLFEDEPVTTP